ncbi:MAG: polyamine ABC transporter ATP-binding protein [Verrucomicrobia bacterium CG_4_10_14_3_um_filter_43_23]|nr:MAG: polyamine ABC transporter ATP-binding protein [Verrucomicrobia bacterium CG1_02_43_26]PIP58709.1 MAG: polyamine ABC transporter ATP-binding protein [Verrucomicrobia bacterium CG22_combo_CG10-13_8_21_14_all_43_17]PIX59030.1 MAG: polyamine ABC transporter ATP-binding protein [Verrucomicrobia bacterium CG_4_10_14_3_um_filter_43_23]PIY61597.1 MAG: polyamine ABC transporter ATP-binding protein [Verrucomicrobia bacterium CG_4_10_14_0_8_um_filter_43_34]PJA44506.1 MAG: polyamine ABC transporter
MNSHPTVISVHDVDLAYGNFVVMRHLTFDIKRGEIFVIMGGSGCGKTTLLKHLIGLQEVASGNIFYGKQNFTKADGDERKAILEKVGILYQAGALWSSMTLAENVALPLQEYTGLSDADIREIVSFKLSLVGLRGFEDFYPAEISGGMRKRAGLARAMALDPQILFFDEPSSGLDPISSKRLDDLILQLKECLGTTIVVVTHELPSIFAIADNSIFLDAESKTIIAEGNPKDLLKNSVDPKVVHFLKRTYNKNG